MFYKKKRIWGCNTTRREYFFKVLICSGVHYATLMSAKLLLINFIEMKWIPSEVAWILSKCWRNLNCDTDVIGPHQWLLAYSSTCLDTDVGCMTIFQKSAMKKCLIFWQVSQWVVMLKPVVLAVKVLYFFLWSMLC